MDTFDLKSVQLGGLRIGGLLGHSLSASRRLFSNRKLLKLTAFAALAGTFGSLGGVFGLHYLRHQHAQEEERKAQALMSPIEKKTYTVEDSHGAGQYMVVRNGTVHLKLECAGGQYKDEKGSQQSFGRGNCYEFKVGDQLMLERWDQDGYHNIVYVYKMKQSDGETDYTQFGSLDRENP